MKKFFILFFGLTACSRPHIMQPEVPMAQVIVTIPPIEVEEYPVPDWQEPLDKSLVKTEEVKQHLEEWTYSLMDYVQINWRKP